MTEVAANYNINMNEFAANMAVEGFQSAEVEAIMKAIGENKTWNAIEGRSHTNANDQGLYGCTAVQNVDKKKHIPPDVVEMAKFAVEAVNIKAGTQLVYNKVLRYAKEDVLAPIGNVIIGTCYQLSIATQDCKGTYEDEAQALKFKNGQKALISYKHELKMN